MSLPASKKLFVNFMVKLLLILVIIGGGISLFSYNKENTAYFKQKQHIVDQLVSLSGVLQSANYSYVNLLNADSAQADSLSTHVTTLSKEKEVLEVLSQDAESNNRAEANAVLSSLETVSISVAFKLSILRMIFPKSSVS